ncbi:MAG: GAF domain-containing protein [Elusimicrobia bacterium]|nr:GAF domain-containing protein [Elusimicrobiota bacterium]
MSEKNGNHPASDDIGLLEIARSLVSAQDVDGLLSEISTAVERLTNSEAASILLLDGDKKQLVFRAATGEKGSSVKRFYVPLGKGVAGWVAEKGEPVMINDVSADTRFTGQIDRSSGFNTKSILAIPLYCDGQLIGVCEALNKIGAGYTDQDRRVLENLGGLAAQAIANARAAEDNRNFFSHMIEIITLAVEGGDSLKAGHSYRVAETACGIARELGISGSEYRDLYYGALLHDIGMLAVHDLRYLSKVSSKTIERTPEKLHALVGAELIKNIRMFSNIVPIIRHHHEFIDGTGHPDGLVGDDIPLASRIICLAEHLDDLHLRGLAGESYQQAAEKMAREGAGTRFDKRVVDAFLSLRQAA